MKGDYFGKRVVRFRTQHNRRACWGIARFWHPDRKLTKLEYLGEIFWDREYEHRTCETPQKDHPSPWETDEAAMTLAPDKYPDTRNCGLLPWIVVKWGPHGREGNSEVASLSDSVVARESSLRTQRCFGTSAEARAWALKNL